MCVPSLLRAPRGKNVGIWNLSKSRWTTKALRKRKNGSSSEETTEAVRKKSTQKPNSNRFLAIAAAAAARTVRIAIHPLFGPDLSLSLSEEIESRYLSRNMGEF